jgi:hypothetical protein
MFRIRALIVPLCAVLPGTPPPLLSPTGKIHRARDLDFFQAIREVLVVPANAQKLLIQLGIARAASLSHCPHHRRTNYKILFRDIYIHINFIMIALLLQNL